MKMYIQISALKIQVYIQNSYLNGHHLQELEMVAVNVHT